MGLSLEKDGRDKWNKSGRDGLIINLFLLPCKNQKSQTQSRSGGHWINALRMVMAVPVSRRTPQSANSTGTRQMSVKTSLCLVAGHFHESTKLQSFLQEARILQGSCHVALGRGPGLHRVRAGLSPEAVSLPPAGRHRGGLVTCRVRPEVTRGDVLGQLA